MASPLRLSGMGVRATDALWRRARSGNGLWLAAAIVAGGLRLLRRWSKREREVVFRSEMKPGEQLTIRHVPRGDDEPSTAAEA